MEYQHATTKVFLVNYHIIFCPKRRRRILLGRVKERLENIIGQVASDANGAEPGCEENRE